MADGFADGSDSETEIEARIRYNPLKDIFMRKLEDRLMKELVGVVGFLKRGPLQPGEVISQYPTISDLVERYKRNNQ